ncbi:MAG: MOSC domain-containing protein [Candidatus Cyclobacteriaceae bacterium M2_1C_046]
MSLKVSQLYIYPIKSLMGVRVKSAKVEQRGLQYDRRWMLVDSNNGFVSQRQISDLVFLQTRITNDKLIVTDSRTSKSYTLSLHPQLYKDKIEVMIWDDVVEAYELSLEANDWFSECLGKDVKLVYMPDEVRRPIDPKWSIDNEYVSFADECPLLIVGAASLNDLNSKVDHSMEMIRFRPNIVVEGGEPYEEYYWKDILIGGYEFRGLKPCARCKVTTIDPATGEAGREPLLTLSKQKIDDKIVFGQHATVVDPAGAVIREDDDFEVITRKSEPYASL